MLCGPIATYIRNESISFRFPLDCATNADNSVTITSYTGPVGAVTIPNTINKLRVTSIETNAFAGSGLVNVTIPGSIATIGDWAFYGCQSLTNVTLSDGVTNIGNYAFLDCPSLAGITIPDSVTNLGVESFASCTNLGHAFFEGNAPATMGPIPVFSGLKSNAMGYYLLGKAGWGPTYSGLPTVLWNPQVSLGDGSFDILAHQFGFHITGNAHIPIVVEACTNLNSGAWVQLQSVTLTNSLFYFTDPQWTNYPGRFYRLRVP